MTLKDFDYFAAVCTDYFNDTFSVKKKKGQICTFRGSTTCLRGSTLNKVTFIYIALHSFTVINRKITLNVAKLINFSCKAAL